MQTGYKYMGNTVYTDTNSENPHKNVFVKHEMSHTIHKQMYFFQYASIQVQKSKTVGSIQVKY